MLAALQDGFDKYEVHEEMRRYLRDVADHNLQASDRVDGFSQILRDMLTVNATLVAQKQNEEMRALTEASHAQGIEVKRISAWAAILFAPTLIGTAYGMNFASMPGLDSPNGFAMAVALMVATCVVLYIVFKRRDWL
jgi:magnesium transporter